MRKELESAIGIGILNAADKLPPEAVLAEHLGVSTLTGGPAQQGLIGARKGPRQLQLCDGRGSGQRRKVRGDLAGMTTDELRDLVDSGAFTAAAAAHLAAARADEQDVMRLRALADRFAAATTPGELRRIASRLHSGLGVAAQSTRLTTQPDPGGGRNCPPSLRRG